MALWMTALKLVPWGDVIEATPQILQAAKKLMGKTRAGSPAAATTSLTGVDGDAPTASVAEQLQSLRGRIAQLEQEQQDSAALIESLAEQNAVVVRAVEALRQRTRRLTQVALGPGIVCAGLLVWVLRQG
jgi:hypothetical protein